MMTTNFEKLKDKVISTLEEIEIDNSLEEVYQKPFSDFLSLGEENQEKTIDFFREITNFFPMNPPKSLKKENEEKKCLLCLLAATYFKENMYEKDILNSKELLFFLHYTYFICSSSLEAPLYFNKSFLKVLTEKTSSLDIANLYMYGIEEKFHEEELFMDYRKLQKRREEEIMILEKSPSEKIQKKCEKILYNITQDLYKGGFKIWE